MTQPKALKAIFSILVGLFVLFAIGYQGGKQLAKVENSSRTNVEEK